MQKLLGSLVCSAGVLGAFALQAEETQPVGFQITETVPTSLEECIEALEEGKPLPALGKDIGGQIVEFVVYDGHFFAFKFDRKGPSFCVKQVASEASGEVQPEPQRDLLPPADE